MKYVLIITILSIGNVFASGDGHSAGHATDLIPPFVNVFILVSFLVWKLKSPFKSYFENKSNEVSEVLERANVKAKEAEMMMQMQSKKAEGLEKEITKIQTEAKENISKFKEDYANEVQDRIKKLKDDAVLKIEAEKKQMMDHVNDLLLDAVINKSKETIKNDSSVNGKITDNILQGLK